MTDNQLSKFWAKVNKTSECWVWTGARRRDGYGIFYIDMNRRQLLAHRLSWEIHNGSIPEGLCILHKCDNPPCINPSHLFLGTIRDNADDCMAKGRVSSKLTKENVPQIRADRANGMLYKALSEKYGVNQRGISYVLYRKTWVDRVYEDKG